MKFISFAFLLAITGCLGAVKVAPVTVEPIHVTIDVNVHDQPNVAQTKKP